jgi:hypothetical protein
MKLTLSLILLLTAGIAISQEKSSNDSNEDKAASRLIKKKREKIRTTETVKQTTKDTGKKADE